MDNPNNIIKLSTWLKQANVFELKHDRHAYMLRKTLEDNEANEALRLSLEACSASSEPLKLIPLNQVEHWQDSHGDDLPDDNEVKGA